MIKILCLALSLFIPRPVFAQTHIDAKDASGLFMTAAGVANFRYSRELGGKLKTVWGEFPIRRVTAKQLQHYIQVELEVRGPRGDETILVYAGTTGREGDKVAGFSGYALISVSMMAMLPVPFAGATGGWLNPFPGMAPVSIPVGFIPIGPVTGSLSVFDSVNCGEGLSSSGSNVSN